MAYCVQFFMYRGGYYAWLRKKPCRSKRLNLLDARKVHNESRQRYGSPRVWRALRSMKVSVSKSTVERIMGQHKLRGKKRRRFKRTTDSNHTLLLAENIVARRFDQGTKNRVWLSNITYLRV